MIDFTNITDVIMHCQGVMVVDLLKHALSIDEELLKTLNDPESGLYLPGEFEPRFYESKIYYPRKNLAFVQDGTGGFFGPNANVDIHMSKGVSDMKVLSKTIDDILDSSLKIVVTAAEMRKYSKHFKSKPTIPAIAVRVVIGVLQAAINRRCRHASVGFNRYRLETLVKPEYQHIIHENKYILKPEYQYLSQEKDFDKDVMFTLNPQFFHLAHDNEFIGAIENLYDEVMDFIGNDDWNLYSYQLKGTSLIINKGVDWRVYEYYRMKFEKEESLLEVEKEYRRLGVC